MNIGNIKLSVIILLYLLGYIPFALAQTRQRETYKFADRDTSSLWLDVYQPNDSVRKNICIMYIFGGGFVKGSRTAKENVLFFDEMATRGYTVIAIDYRLGLKGVKPKLFNLKPLFQAPRYASEDLISATEFVIKNAEKLRVDPARIVLIGSSAGAITALHADYELSNRTAMVKNLPERFRYAAVVSLAGGIISGKDRPRYTNPPAPTLFFHGTKDKIVNYNKITLFGKGMYGSNSLVRIFKKEKYPFMFVRYKGIKHKVATFTRFEAQDQICDFIDEAVGGNYHNELDITIRNMELQEKYNH